MERDALSREAARADIDDIRREIAALGDVAGEAYGGVQELRADRPIVAEHLRKLDMHLNDVDSRLTRAQWFSRASLLIRWVLRAHGVTL